MVPLALWLFFVYNSDRSFPIIQQRWLRSIHMWRFFCLNHSTEKFTNQHSETYLHVIMITLFSAQTTAKSLWFLPWSNTSFPIVNLHVDEYFDPEQSTDKFTRVFGALVTALEADMRRTNEKWGTLNLTVWGSYLQLHLYV